jgi:phospholipid/cholesterol/gamma-HCH transport system permease protein
VFARGNDAAVVVMRSSSRPSTVTATTWTKPASAIGDFVVLAGETFAAMFRPPFAWRELIEQIWFVARVSIVPTLVLSIPYTVLIVFTLNIVLIEVGAGDLSGAGAALASVTQVGPVVTAIVVSGAAATAMCADLGARTIREEIDAMKVIGVNAVQALVVPRVIAATFVALMLYSLVAVVGLAGSYFFVVFIQHVTPGAFVAGMTLPSAPSSNRAVLFEIALTVVVSAISQPWMQFRRWNGAVTCLYSAMSTDVTNCDPHVSQNRALSRGTAPHRHTVVAGVIASSAGPAALTDIAIRQAYGDSHPAMGKCDDIDVRDTDVSPTVVSG